MVPVFEALEVLPDFVFEVARLIKSFLSSREDSGFFFLKCIMFWKKFDNSIQA